MNTEVLNKNRWKLFRRCIYVFLIITFVLMIPSFSNAQYNISKCILQYFTALIGGFAAFYWVPNLIGFKLFAMIFVNFFLLFAHPFKPSYWTAAITILAFIFWLFTSFSMIYWSV